MINKKISKYFCLLLFIAISPSIIAGKIIPPSVKYVSVTKQGHVIIEWEKSPSPGITLYSILRDKKSFSESLEAIDTLKYNQSLFYKDVLAYADKKARKYAINAIKGSDGKSIQSDAHTTVFLKVNYDSCKVSANLVWTPYIGWNKIKEYQIWQKKEGESALMATKVNSTKRNYYTKNLESNKEYTFFVVAVNANDSTLISNSNYVKAFAGVTKSPLFIKSIKTKVNNDKEFETHWSWDSHSELKNYYLLRSDDSGIFDTIKRVTNYKGGGIVLKDRLAVTNEKVFNYKLVALNKCLDVVKESPLCNNILLKLEQQQGSSVSLSWNTYLGIKEENVRYQIYRILEEKNLLQTITGLLYLDQLKITEYKQTKEACYYILAYDRNNNLNTSTSNIACIPFKPRVFMPNAFNPFSSIEKDKYFGPVTNMEPDEFRMEIANRWGNTVFTSSDFSQFWSGEDSSGKVLSGGAYLYYVFLRFSNGEEFKLSGSFMLVR